MKSAFTFYGKVHREYWWLHAIFFVILTITSVFWFILPFFIVSYGYYEPSLILNIILALFLLVSPSMFITLHCWFISYNAAKRWELQYPQENRWLWLVIFQTMAFLVVILFTFIIFSLFFFIDLIR
ncbi:hypothetical protein [Solibacillus sp. CAU 1738]|uniref:hypothetical protein n=1 Tax=Solibacillus sp. CAU 1738 TaxID=3140363 RepID=UPI00326081D8